MFLYKDIKIDISIFISDLIELRRYPDISIIFIYFHMIFVFRKMAILFFRSQLLHHTLYCITVLYFVKLFHKIFSHLKKEIYLDRVQRVHDTVLHNSSNGSYRRNLKKKYFFCFLFSLSKRKGNWPAVIFAPILETPSCSYSSKFILFDSKTLE